MKNIKQLRELKGLTQQELATRAGIGLATLSRLELGKCTPNKSTIAVIASALEVEPGEIKI